MPDSSFHIRPAQLSDIPDILDIYSYHVLHGTATFEEEVPSLENMRDRFTQITQASYPYLVAEENGLVIAYAYLSSYRPRKAYRFTVEDSIYIHKDHVGKGLGSALLQRLIAEAEQGPWRLMIAVIGDSQNHASIKLHEKLGFTLTGIEPASGYKFNRWIDTVLMYRPIGLGATAPAK